MAPKSAGVLECIEEATNKWLARSNKSRARRELQTSETQIPCHRRIWADARTPLAVNDQASSSAAAMTITARCRRCVGQVIGG